VINNSKFSERLKMVMDYYQLSAAAFADRINVQRSSISHLLSGRNKPSLDFVLKVLEEFKEVELYWLMNGKGSFPATNENHSIDKSNQSSSNTSQQKENIAPDEIERIIIFYKDGSFKNYTP